MSETADPTLKDAAPRPAAFWLAPVLVWTVVGVALLTMPLIQEATGLSGYLLTFLYLVFFWVAQASSWNLFSGFSGYFSFGQAAFFGTGVYAAAILISRFDGPLAVAIPLGALVAGLLAAAIGTMVFRLRSLAGEVFALFTLSLSLGLALVANNFDVIDGGGGIILGDVAYPDFFGSLTIALYYGALAIAATAVLAALLLQHSRIGFGLFMIRDDEHAAETAGVPVFNYKLVAFAVSGAVAGASGALHAVQINFVSPGVAFSPDITLFAIVMSAVGGRRHWAGPVIGALFIYTLIDRLTSARLADVSLILLGLILVFVVVRLPEGVYPQLVRRAMPAVAVGGVALAVMVVADAGNLILQVLVAMVAVLAVTLVPQPIYAAAWRRAAGLRRAAP